ncbi:MAG: Smr/MutS family protein [Chitinophagaceae bacterium]
MKFEKGDKIILLHSREEGHVVDLINNEMALVEVEGVQFPVYLDQIDYPYFNQFFQKKIPNAIKSKLKGEDIPIEKWDSSKSQENGVFLSFLPVYYPSPDSEEIELLKLNLVNQTKLRYWFHFKIFFQSKLFLEIQNEINSFSHFYLQDILTDQLNEKPKIELLFSLSEKNSLSATTFEKEIKIKPKEIFKKIQNLISREDATFIYKIFQNFPEPPQPIDTKDLFLQIPIPPGINSGTKGTSYLGLELPKYEVDLHIDKILPDWKGLNNFELLTLQINEFQKWLDLAIAHQQFSMVVIHGVGKGKLKDEIHKILQKTREVRNFVNQYDVRYGYGATEIFFKF